MTANSDWIHAAVLAAIAAIFHYFQTQINRLWRKIEECEKRHREIDRKKAAKTAMKGRK